MATIQKQVSERRKEAAVYGDFGKRLYRRIVSDDIPRNDFIADARQIFDPQQINSGKIFGNINVAGGFLQSENFVTGSAGWKLTAEGNFEGNAGTFRGALEAGELHIPDETTASSFHVETDGSGWVGATTSNRVNAPMLWTAAGALTVTNLTIASGTSSGIAQFTDAGTLAVQNSVNLNSSEVTNKSLANLDSTADTKLSGIETSATTDQTGAEIKTAYQAEANAFTDTKDTKLTGIETSATADQSGSEIKTAYQAEANAFTDTKNTKLTGIATNADVTSSNTANNASNYTGNSISVNNTDAKATDANADQTSANTSADTTLVNTIAAATVQDRAETLFEKQVFIGNANDGLGETAGSGTITRELLKTRFSSIGGTPTILRSTDFGTAAGDLLDYDKDWEYVFTMELEDIQSDVFYGISDGDYSSDVPATHADTIRHMGFFIEDGTLWASNANGTTQTVTDISSGITIDNILRMRIVWDATTSILFYVNDVLEATHTTFLPSQGTPKILFAQDNGGSGGPANGIYNNYTLILTI